MDETMVSADLFCRVWRVKVRIMIIKIAFNSTDFAGFNSLYKPLSSARIHFYRFFTRKYMICVCVCVCMHCYVFRLNSIFCFVRHSEIALSQRMKQRFISLLSLYKHVYKCLWYEVKSLRIWTVKTWTIDRKPHVYLYGWFVFLLIIIHFVLIINHEIERNIVRYGPKWKKFYLLCHSNCVVVVIE